MLHCIQAFTNTVEWTMQVKRYTRKTLLHFQPSVGFYPLNKSDIFTGYYFYIENINRMKMQFNSLLRQDHVSTSNYWVSSIYKIIDNYQNITNTTHLTMLSLYIIWHDFCLFPKCNKFSTTWFRSLRCKCSTFLGARTHCNTKKSVAPCIEPKEKTFTRSVER